MAAAARANHGADDCGGADDDAGGVNMFGRGDGGPFKAHLARR